MIPVCEEVCLSSMLELRYEIEKKNTIYWVQHDFTVFAEERYCDMVNEYVKEVNQCHFSLVGIDTAIMVMGMYIWQFNMAAGNMFQVREQLKEDWD